MDWTAIMHQFGGQPTVSISTEIILLFILIFIACGFTFSQKRRLNLPPGPKALPLIGNIHQMLNDPPIRVLQGWHEKYGNMVSFRFGPQIAISVGSLDMIHELINKRGAKYNSRPRFIIPSERMTGGLNMAIMPHGEAWQNHHRIANSFLDSTSVNGYVELQDLETKQMLHELLASSDFESSIRRYCGSMMTTLAYGFRLEDIKTQIPSDILRLNEQPFIAVGNASFTMVELFPILDRLPGFLAPWKALSADVKQAIFKYHMKHLQKAESTSSWNWVKEALQSKAGSKVSRDELAWVIGTLEQAGFEAILTVLRLLIKAAVLYPNDWRNLQHELDEVVGTDRIPTSKDVPQLPYLNAFINEALRWQPPTPLAIPHATTEDDEYMGYHIPKGTVVIPNISVLSTNPEVFPNPEEFKPERWIQNPSLRHSPFGFGRRICPGRHFAENGIYILTARLAWAYSIEHTYKDGKRIEIDPWDIRLTFTAATQPFPATFKVRSFERQKIIESEWENGNKNVDVILEGIRAKRAR